MSENFAEIWQTLSKVDLSAMVEKKMGLNYLSWASAWSVLMEHYPSATFNMLPQTDFEDGSVEVWCSVTIGEHTRTMWLPVMDHRNNSITIPSSRQVSDARMRCLVKCLAMFGLGLYIYRGEDLPAKEKDQNAEKEAIINAVKCISACSNIDALNDVFKRITNGHDRNSALYKACAEAGAKRKEELKSGL